VELVRGLEETWDALRSLLHDVQPDQWSLPTPCSIWSVRDVAAHLGAIEGGFQGFAQPEPPAEWTTELTGLDAWTAAGVAARAKWPIEDVLDEVDRAAEAQLTRLRALDDAGWEAATTGPAGPTTMRGLTQLRTFDLWVHLLDLRAALGHALAPDDEPTAQRVAVQRAYDLTGWGAVKRAKLPDGTRVHLSLTGAAAFTGDVVVEGGRARLEPSAGGMVDDRIDGTATAYLLVTTGRSTMAVPAGGISARGHRAQQLLSGYRMF